MYSIGDKLIRINGSGLHFPPPQYSVVFTVNPVDAVVVFNGVEGLTHTVLAGSYEYTVTADGYVTVVDTVVVLEDTQIPINMELIPTFTIASGGEVTYDGDYAVHTFTSNSTFSVQQVGSDNNFEYLVVAGGGGGGAGSGTNTAGGGGGAGGMLEGVLNNIIPNLYSITVGAGGTYGNSGNGGNSSFAGITSTGGGFGQNYTGASTGAAGNGGSGGGVSSRGSGHTAGTGIVGQGHNGGSWISYNQSAAGGGAGDAGGSVSTGGGGKSSSITGTAVVYATGGEGRFTSAVGNATAVPANRGNGGRAGNINNTTAYNGSAGGSGIVVIRYRYK